MNNRSGSNAYNSLLNSHGGGHQNNSFGFRAQTNHNHQNNNLGLPPELLQLLNDCGVIRDKVLPEVINRLLNVESKLSATTGFSAAATTSGSTQNVNSGAYDNSILDTHVGRDYGSSSSSSSEQPTGSYDRYANTDTQQQAGVGGDHYNQKDYSTGSFDNSNVDVPVFEEEVAQKEIEMSNVTSNEFNLIPVNEDMFSGSVKVNVSPYIVGSFKNASVKKVNGIRVEGLSNFDIRDIDPELSKEKLCIMSVTDVNKAYKANKLLFTKELLVPAEALPNVLARLLETVKEVETIVFLEAIDRSLVRRLNDYIEVNVGYNPNLTSYAFGSVELFDMFKSMDADSGRALMNDFNNIINSCFRDVYDSYIDSLGEEETRTYVINDSWVMSTNIYTKLLGINIQNLSYDKYSTFGDLSQDYNEFAYLIRETIKSQTNDRQLILITKEKDKLLFMIDASDNLYVKRFSSFM